MQQVDRVEQQTLLHGERLEQLVRDAGFIDIRVRVKKFKIGAWGPGYLTPLH